MGQFVISIILGGGGSKKQKKNKTNEEVKGMTKTMRKVSQGWDFKNRIKDTFFNRMTAPNFVVVLQLSLPLIFPQTLVVRFYIGVGVLGMEREGVREGVINMSDTHG